MYDDWVRGHLLYVYVCVDVWMCVMRECVYVCV